jgi:hypothetical protein
VLHPCGEKKKKQANVIIITVIYCKFSPKRLQIRWSQIWCIYAELITQQQQPVQYSPTKLKQDQSRARLVWPAG